MKEIRRKRFPAGFTLIEILIVVTIIGLFAAIVSVNLLKHPDEARQVAARVQIKAYMTALTAYKLDMGSFPGQEVGLAALWWQPETEPGWRGPYLTGEVAKDPWNRAYIYRFPGAHGDLPDIVSYGADGKVGGEGPIAIL